MSQLVEWLLHASDTSKNFLHETLASQSILLPYLYCFTFLERGAISLG